MTSYLSYATLGIVATLGIILLVIVLALFWKYLNKRIELMTQKGYEKDKTEHAVKFRQRHEQQINAAHDCYSDVQRIEILMSNREGKDKLNEMSGKEIFPQMLGARNSFLEKYSANKIVFSKKLCGKIDEFIPKLDKYLLHYKDGFASAEQVHEQQDWIAEQPERKEGEVPYMVVTGSWNPEESEKVREPLREIIADIEEEFRELYETKE